MSQPMTMKCCQRDLIEAALSDKRLAITDPSVVLLGFMAAGGAAELVIGGTGAIDEAECQKHGRAIIRLLEGALARARQQFGVVREGV